MPDVVSLAAPRCALLNINGSQDRLFPIESGVKAVETAVAETNGAVTPEEIDAFRAAFAEHARTLLPEEPRPELRVDLDLPLAEATPDLARYLAHAGPFGVGNPTPVFVARGVRVKDAKPVGDGRHLRLNLTDGGARLAAIAFRMAETHGEIAASGGPVDAAFQLQEDSWNGRTRLQARLVDLRPAE